MRFEGDAGLPFILLRIRMNAYKGASSIQTEHKFNENNTWTQDQNSNDTMHKS